MRIPKPAAWARRDWQNFKRETSLSWAEFAADPIARTTTAAVALALVVVILTALFLEATAP